MSPAEIAETPEDEPENVPCIGCGGTELPLHVDRRCPDCRVLDAEVDEYGPDWWGDRL